MKKIVLAFAVFVLCMGAFSSCDTQKTEFVTNGVGEYTIVRNETIRDTGKLSYIVKMMNLISDAVKEKCGCELPIDTDWLKKGEEPDSGKKEILIGETNRPETAEALERLGDAAYGVMQIGNKIVIVGKSDYMLSLAVDRFVDESIGKRSRANDGSLYITGNIDYTAAGDDFLDLGKYEIVYTRDYEDPYAYAYYDYSFDEQTVAKDLAETLKQSYGIKLPVTMDYVYGGVEDEYGILLGRCEREETESVKSSLAYNEYAIKVVNRKVVVTGHGFHSTYAAILKFKEMVGRFSITENGSTRICIPQDLSYVGVLSGAEEWDLDVPRYEGGKTRSVSDLGDGSYLVKINDTDKSEYENYVGAIEKSGFRKYTENEINGNLFATYTSDKSVVHLQYAPVYDRATVSVEPASETTLFGKEAENDKTIVTTPKLIQLRVFDENIENGGMCYIIRLENGKFVIVDSGQEDESADLIYEQLAEYNVLEGKPVIYAWIFTHWHGDHYRAYTKSFFPRYASAVKIENFIYSFPMDRFYYNAYSAMSSYTSFKNTTKIGNYIRPHAGDVMYLGNMKLTFLYTQDEFLPHTFEFFNDSSLTFMIEYEGQKTLITGDASENSCTILVDMYGDKLKCDILQVPHHGHFGANKAFIDATDPWVALIPASAMRYETKLTQSFYTAAAPLRYLLASKNIKEFYVQGMGTVALDLPYKPE